MQRLLNGSSSTMDVRKVHDVFGWCAKAPVRCVGAIYRSEAFMALEPHQRDASKPRGIDRSRWPRNIHIEHTILASQLHRLWLDSTSDRDPLFFVRNGIATALHVQEEQALGGDHRTINPCFDPGPSFGLPFRRYLGRVMGLRIWNVFMGERVNLETYSMDDHRNTVAALIDEASSTSI